jgi:long-chain acyl-CoA synthetase
MTPLSIPESTTREVDTQVGSAGVAGTAQVVRAETLPALLEARVRATPDGQAYAELGAGSGWHYTSWSEHLHQVRLLAGGLARHGLARGERVLILAPTRLAWERVQMAVFACGAVAVGVDPRIADAHLDQIVRRVAPSVLVVNDAGQLDRLPAAVVAAAKLRVSLTGDDGRAGLHTLEAIAAAADTDEKHDPWDRVQADDPAIVVFTSGTTGDPKGIAYSHRQVCLACEALLATFPQIEAGDRFACWLPLANLFQRMVNFFAIARGVTTYFVPDPRELMTLLPAIRPHMLIGVPRFYEKLHAGIEARIAAAGVLRPLVRYAWCVGERVAASERHGGRPSAGLRALHALLDPLVLARIRRSLGGSLRFLVSGSAPMPVWLLERLHGLGLLVLEAYGTSENIVPIAANRLDAYRFGTVGRPLPGNELRLDAEGELEVRGPGVFSGYLDDPDRGMFTADGFLRTGDYAEWTDDGFLRLKGRRSEIFKTSTGRRIAPFAIEQRLLALPWVEHALATGAGRKFVLALLAVNPESLRAWAEARGLAGGLAEPIDPALAQALWQAVEAAVSPLAAHERPAGCVLVTRPFGIDSGELTPNLKLRRNRVQERYGPCLERLYAEIEAGGENRVRVCP